jgi:hypothetical protein
MKKAIKIFGLDLIIFPVPRQQTHHRLEHGIISKAPFWINQHLIEPPIWKRAGLKGHAEIPLIDEGYEYRDLQKYC